MAKFNTNWLGETAPPAKPGMSTGEKVVAGGLGLALLGGLFAALGSGKPASKPAGKPGLGKPGCGPCGR
jgi:hypothetical protein